MRGSRVALLLLLGAVCASAVDERKGGAASRGGGQATTLVGGKRDKDEKVKNKPTEKENGFLDQTTNEELHKDVTVGTKDGAGSILGCNVEEDTCGGSCPIPSLYHCVPTKVSNINGKPAACACKTKCKLVGDTCSGTCSDGSPCKLAEARGRDEVPENADDANFNTDTGLWNTYNKYLDAGIVRECYCNQCQPMPVKPIAWWDFEDDIESDGYTEDKIGNVRVVLREKSGAVKTVDGWVGNALWFNPDSCDLEDVSNGGYPTVQSTFKYSQSSSKIFHLQDNNAKGVSVSAWVYWVPRNTLCDNIQGQGNEIIRVGLKYANDDDENPLGGFAVMSDPYPPSGGGLHWHLDNYRKVPIMNTSKGFPDQYNYLPVQRWAHLVITWDNEANTEEEKGVGRVYIDGNMVGEVSTSKQEMFLTNQNVEIGTAWGGAIDELMVFDRALTQCQIDKIYSAGHAGLCDDAHAPLSCIHDAIVYGPLVQTVPMITMAGGREVFKYTRASLEYTMRKYDRAVKVYTGEGAPSIKNTFNVDIDDSQSATNKDGSTDSLSTGALAAIFGGGALAIALTIFALFRMGKGEKEKSARSPGDPTSPQKTFAPAAPELGRGTMYV